MASTNLLKSAGRFYTWLILFHAAYVTLRISIIYIIYTFFYKGTTLRQKGNNLLQWWSTQLLKSIKLSFQATPFPTISLSNNRPCIIMSNHRSFYDIPLILLAAKHLTIRMVTKQELFRIPLWGRALRLSEFIPLNRQNKRLAMKQLQYAKTKLEDGITLWISPEGTRSKKNELLHFKNGGFKLAKQMDAIIIPVFIHYSHNIFNEQKCYQLGMKARLLAGNPVDTRDFDDINLLRDMVYDVIKQNSIKIITTDPKS